MDGRNTRNCSWRFTSRRKANAGKRSAKPTSDGCGAWYDANPKRERGFERPPRLRFGLVSHTIRFMDAAFLAELDRLGPGRPYAPFDLARARAYCRR